MLIMFARMNEAFQTIGETLVSRGIWTHDDGEAFAHSVHFDDTLLKNLITRTWGEYIQCAKALGVVTGFEDAPPL